MATEHCELGRPRAGKFDFLLWGDSHAIAITPQIARQADAYGLSGLAAGIAACPPLDGVTLHHSARLDHRCRVSTEAVLRYIRDHDIRRIILAGRWALYADGTDGIGERANSTVISSEGRHGNVAEFARLLSSTIKTLADDGREIVLVASVPEPGFSVPSMLGRSAAWHAGLPEPLSLAAYRQQQRHVIPLLQSLAVSRTVQLLYPHETFCPGGRCAVANADGMALFFDDNHLSRNGAAMLKPQFDRVFQAWKDQVLLAEK